MTLPSLARRLGVFLVLSAFGGAAPAVAAPPGDLEALTTTEAAKRLDDGTLTSVELTQAYIDRINAVNKRGPGLNAVTQLNKDALVDAAESDRLRKSGVDLGPAMGLPVLVKDIVDAKGLYTSAGNWSLRNSFPAEDSGIVKGLREDGAIILGKLGLSEFANSFGNQPSGFSNLTGQVINAVDADQNPSGSSSGSGAAGAAALSALTIGTETSGSIISPSATQGLVGLRPTIGLVPPYGIAPIIASQDTAGPMSRTVGEAAILLQAIANPSDPKSAAEYNTVFGPDYIARGVIKQPPATVPDYLSALDTGFVTGKRIGYIGDITAAGPLKTAYDALVAGGATMVPVTTNANPAVPAVPTGYEQHLTIDTYYAGLGPNAPIKNLVEEVDDNLANPLEALKFGNATHLSRSQVDISPGSANETAFRTNLPQQKQARFAALDAVYNRGTPGDASDDVIAVLGASGSLNNTPQAGYPQVTIPMGYSDTQRRALAISVHGPTYAERDLIGIAYVVEQATKLRKPVSSLNPSMYRCADTTPAPPFAGRGHCNPDYDEIMTAVGERPQLGFALENETAQALQERLSSGSLSSETLVKAYLARIALSNAEGPATQAVRDVDLGAIDRAKALDAERAQDGRRSLLHGVPVIVDDVVDVKGLATTGGSVALQDSKPAASATLVRRLERAGAIVLGKANVSEFNGVLDANAVEGYSSLGGQVLLPSDTDKTPAGSSGGSAAATASGLAALAVGLETSPDTAQLIAPATAAGVVGLKPTVGRVSRAGVLGVARSQDAPGVIAKSVFDAALALQPMAGRDGADPATAAVPFPAPDYTASLSGRALRGKRIGVIASSAVGYPEALGALGDAGATAVTKAQPAAVATASVTTREFKRDFNAYLDGADGGSNSLAEVIDYNIANPVEGLKYGQGELAAAQAVDLTDAAQNTAFTNDRDGGRTEARGLIDTALNNNTPADATDDVELLMVPSGNALVATADRAGYPVLTLPSGFGAQNSGAGRNPVGVAFIATGSKQVTSGNTTTNTDSESTLLSDGFAFEQVLKVRQAPSQTNPSMWRCVPGSAFFSPHHCHPGDRASRLVLTPVSTVAPVTTPSATPTPTATATTTATATPPGTPPATPGTPPAGTVPPGLLTTITTGLQKESLQEAIGKKVGGRTGSLKFSDSFLGSGTAIYTLRIKIGSKLVTLGKKTVKPTKAGSRTVKITLGKSARKRLRKHPKSKVTLKTVFKPSSGGGKITTVRTVKRK